MRDFKALSKEERLKLAEDSLNRSLGESVPVAGEHNNRLMPMLNMEVAPPKPDPEADAEASIRASIEKARANSINPETGMPFYAPPQPISPEEAKRREEMQMKAEFLRRRSQGQ
jgi:hypothetical protein